MADNGSDSDTSITGWTVVNDAGECEVSDSGSTSSSLEFVQLEETAALYQRRASDHGKGSGKRPANQPEETDLTLEDAAVENPQDAPVGVTENAPVDVTEDDNTLEPEIEVPEPSTVSTPETLGPLDLTSASTDDHSPSPTENESEPPQEEEDVTFEPLTPDPTDDLDQDPTPQSVPETQATDDVLPEPKPGTSSQDDNAIDDVVANQNQQIELLHAALVRQESDSDSDFVRLDLISGESGDQPTLLADVARLMQISGASGTSDTSRASSSISANFRFVNPPIAPSLQPRRPEEEEEEEDSLIGEFDDRCESDISGVATDDTDDSDLSSMIYSLDDVPLIAGRRLYRHRPNPSLNSVLTVISLVALFLAIGIAVGHYIGVSRDGWLRKMQVERMKGAQDNHLICLKQADMLKGKLRKLTNQGFDAGGTPTVGKTATPGAGTDVLQKSDGGPTGPGPIQSQHPNNYQIQQNPDDTRTPSRVIVGQSESVPNKESESVAELKNFIQVLREQLNRAQMENADLRTEVTRLRYTAHPANAHVSAEVAQRQLKVKVNQLASENDDLKSAVGKMRYTILPSNVEEITDGSNHTEDTPPNVSTSLKDVAVLEQKLENVSLELAAEKKMNQYLQGIVASKEKPAEEEPAKPAELKSPSSVLSCVRQHFPGVVSLSAKYIDKAGHTTQEYWAKLNEATKGTTNQIVDKWNELIKLVGSTQIEDLKLPEEMEKLLQLAWKVEETIKNTVTGVDENNNQSEPENRSSNSWRNISKPTIAHFQDYVNKTKVNMSKLTHTLQETWQKVKNLSKDLLSNPEDTVNKVHDKLREQVTVIGVGIKTKWDEVKGKIHPKNWMDEKKKPHQHHHHHKHHHAKQHHEKQHHHHHHHKHDKERSESDYRHQQHQQRQEQSEDRMPFGDTPKPFEDKPQHKQRKSSHEQYNEFWKKTEYDPDDFFHEGFFEGNQREWRKHQKRLNYLHGRIHRLNEDILYSMDDDDIEDIYDDLDDLEDDLEDEDQPKTLQTWLACQVRWWKSRLHRKHRSENLIKGCGQQIMQWQLRALCKEPCYGKKCSRKRGGPQSHPLCQRILQSQDSSCQYNGQASQCHHDIKNFHSIPSQEAQDLKASKDKIVKPTPHKPADSSYTRTVPQRRVQPPNDDHLFTMEPATTPSNVEEKANNTAWDDEEKEEIPEFSPKVEDVPASPQSSGDNVAEQSSDSDASWIFERAILREYHHHNPDWVFERAAERDLERNKPWYVRRSDEREYRRAKKQYDEERAP